MRFPAAGLLLTLTLLHGALPAPARAGDTGSAFLNGWKRVVLVGRKALFLRGEVTLTLGRSAYRSPLAGATANPVPAIVLGTETQVNIFGVQRAPTRTWSYIEAGSNRSLGFEELKEGKSSKTIVFGEESFRHVRARMPRGSRDLPPDEWEVHYDAVKPYLFEDGETLPEGEFLHDSFSLIYLVMQADLKSPGQSAGYVILYKGKLFRVRLEAGRVRDNERKVKDLVNGGTRKLRLREREILLSAVGAGAEDVRALSLKGEVEIWIDDATHTVLEVSGKVPGFPGRIQLKIKEVEPGEA